MKRMLTTITLAFAVVMLDAGFKTASAQPGIGVSISYQTFYDELSPHGRWIDYPDYGYVWAPNLGSDFQPYNSGGQWVWTDDYEWMWVSDYSWGWAPFHYGRWFYDDYYGWMWVPGYEWSPGWVSWRSGGDYYGWAPLRPGISISIGFGSYNPPYNYWCFAPRRYIGHRNIGRYCVDRGRNVTIINNTTIINNYYGNRNNIFINGGPRRHDAERYAGRIRPVNFRETDRPGGREFRNNSVRMYRPQIQRDNDRRFAPRSFDRYERNTGNAGNNRRNVFDRNNNNNRPPVNENANARDRRFERAQRNIERNNGGFRQQDNGQREPDRRLERRNVFDRNSNDNVNERRRQLSRQNEIRQQGREINRQPDQQPSPEVRNNRRNVFDRPRSDAQQQMEERRRERPVFDRNEGQKPNNRGFERRNREVQPNEQRTERREIFQRNQSNPQIDRRQQVERTREFRQFENRGNDNRREQPNNNGNGGGRRFERRNG